MSKLELVGVNHYKLTVTSRYLNVTTTTYFDNLYDAIIAHERASTWSWISVNAK